MCSRVWRTSYLLCLITDVLSCLMYPIPFMFSLLHGPRALRPLCPTCTHASSDSRSKCCRVSPVSSPKCICASVALYPRFSCAPRASLTSGFSIVISSHVSHVSQPPCLAPLLFLVFQLFFQPGVWMVHYYDMQLLLKEGYYNGFFKRDISFQDPLIYVDLNPLILQAVRNERVCWMHSLGKKYEMLAKCNLDTLHFHNCNAYSLNDRE